MLRLESATIPHMLPTCVEMTTTEARPATEKSGVSPYHHARATLHFNFSQQAVRWRLCSC